MLSKFATSVALFSMQAYAWGESRPEWVSDPGMSWMSGPSGPSIPDKQGWMEGPSGSGAWKPEIPSYERNYNPEYSPSYSGFSPSPSSSMGPRSYH